jgi:alpha-tubulin suppressor-like RCC1 family protein
MVMGGGAPLGVGGTPPVTNIPQQISTDTWKSFSAGGGTSYGIKSDGTLWAWGANTNGQLGLGYSSSPLELPQQIGTDTNWETVQARNFATTMATKTDGSVWYWGTNYYGEFGNGTDYDNNFYMSPQQTTGICVTTLDTPTFQIEDSFSLYPNPAASKITVAYPSNIKEATLELYDLTGRCITKKALNPSDSEATLAVDTYPAGMYMLVVKQADTILWQNKLIIK